MNFSPLTIYLLSALLIGGAMGVLYLVLRGPSTDRPNGVFEWGGVVLFLLVVFTAGGLILLTLGGQSARPSGPAGVRGQPAPALEFRLVGSNESRTLSDFQGEVVLLNLWATWCPPCLEELPELNRFQETYGPKGVVVLTISDERRETIQRFQREQLSLNTVSGYLPPDRKWPSPYDRVLESRPVSFVIDRDGIIRETWSGAEDFDTFERTVVPYLSPV